MGVTNLLQFLREIIVSTNLNRLNLSGRSIAFDGMGLLHRGGVICAKELATGIPSDKHVRFCMSIVDLFRKHGMATKDMIMVVDNLDNPNILKAETNLCRSEQRAEALRIALHLESEGKTSEAEKFYRSAIIINKTSIGLLQAACDLAGVKFVVARGEADSHLAYLSRSNQVDLVVGEDSDFVAYGATTCLYKIKSDGSCDLYARSKLPKLFPGWTDDQFVLFCVLAGCDYFSLDRVGIKRAFSICSSQPTLAQLKLHLRTTLSLPRQDIQQLSKAYLLFLYAAPLHLLRPLPPAEELADALDVCVDQVDDHFLAFLLPCIQSKNS